MKTLGEWKGEIQELLKHDDHTFVEGLTVWQILEDWEAEALHLREKTRRAGMLVSELKRTASRFWSLLRVSLEPIEEFVNKLGNHEGPCDHDFDELDGSPMPCSVHVNLFFSRQKSALAEIDKIKIAGGLNGHA